MLRLRSVRGLSASDMWSGTMRDSAVDETRFAAATVAASAAPAARAVEVEAVVEAPGTAVEGGRERTMGPAGPK